MWYDFKNDLPEVGSTVITFSEGIFEKIIYDGKNEKNGFSNVFWTFPPYGVDDGNRINWENPDYKITNNFTVHEALWLPSIGEYHIPTENEKKNIYKMALRMELIRKIFLKAIIVHCWIRPSKVNCKNEKYNGIDYNKLVGGAEKSWHINGLAVDFHVLGHITKIGCDTIKNRIFPMMNQYDIRMKDNPGSTFIHIDCGTVTNERFFK